MSSPKRHILLSVATGGFVRNHNENWPSIQKWWPHDTKAWVNDLPPKSLPHSVAPYAFKAYAAKWAFSQGYDTITWIDSSIYMENWPYSYLDRLQSIGYYVQDNGFACSQTCTDKLLNHFNISRDKAQLMREIVGGFWGLTYTYASFIDDLVNCATVGLMCGSHSHNSLDSSDPRFLFCRHDQSVMSVLVARHNMTIADNDGKHHFAFGPSQRNANQCFILGR